MTDTNDLNRFYCQLRTHCDGSDGYLYLETEHSPRPNVPAIHWTGFVCERCQNERVRMVRDAHSWRWRWVLAKLVRFQPTKENALMFRCVPLWDEAHGGGQRGASADWSDPMLTSTIDVNIQRVIDNSPYPPQIHDAEEVFLPCTGKREELVRDWIDDCQPEYQLALLARTLQELRKIKETK